MSIKKILLTNSYAVNNGDMALVLALVGQLSKRGYTVSIATFYYTFLKKHYPQLLLVRELLDYRFLRYNFIKKLFLLINFRFNKKYRTNDLFISSPGGYVNSYYGLRRCLLPLIEAKKIGKKTAIYSQSVGPLNDRDKRLLSEFSKQIDTILVRDTFSWDCIHSIKCYSDVMLTKDAAFLLEPRESRAPVDCKKVAVSVREWGFDGRSGSDFESLIITLCKLTLQAGYEIEFISTCQGVPGYRDDSQMALKIYQQLLNANQNWHTKLSLSTNYITVFQLQEKLNKEYAFTIGTRLHMCILSMINGIPAFNISYEVKGLECYQYLDLANCSVDYNEPTPSASKSFLYFLENLSSIKNTVVQKTKTVHQECIDSLEVFLKRMNI